MSEAETNVASVRYVRMCVCEKRGRERGRARESEGEKRKREKRERASLFFHCLKKNVVGSAHKSPSFGSTASLLCFLAAAVQLEAVPFPFPCPGPCPARSARCRHWNGRRRRSRKSTRGKPAACDDAQATTTLSRESSSKQFGAGDGGSLFCATSSSS